MLNRGTEWRRWEPHIHAPGTILNNQFGGGDPWGSYLATVEGLRPKIEAIGVTDYYVTDTYEEVLRRKDAGRLPDVKLIFPSIEIRLDIAAKSGFVNLHLVVSPEDANHLAELRRILTRLQFLAHGDRFDCTRDDLVRLGKRSDPSITDDRAALAHGATQFKVNFDQLRKVYGESDWAKKNILIAVEGGETDGTSGLREAADATVRQEIEKFSHIIFASSQAQREFWLGERSATIEELRARYNGCVAVYNQQVTQKRNLIAGYNADLAKLVVKGTEVQARRHAELSRAAQALKVKIQDLGNQRRTFLTMQDEVRSMRATKAPKMLRELQARHTRSGLNTTQWADFLLVYKGNVDKALADYVVWADREIAKINGDPPSPGDPNVALIADGEDLATVKLAKINAEMTRLERFISADTVVRRQYGALSTRIAQENIALKALETRLTDAQGAAARGKALQTEREEAYGRVFDAIVGEQNSLTGLYAPLMERLSCSSGTLKKLGFSVSRVVHADAWGGFAEEELIDCRKSGPFYGRGSLIKLANSELRLAWETGNAAVVQTAMTGFIARYWKDLIAHAPYVPAQKQEFRDWLRKFARWLFSTDHIDIRYEIAYDGVDIRKLSPGTRGIVLLLLYLALDDADDRPLVIDQPEENLDPKSVFDELVSLFTTAKTKRQVIMVTHNANLVVNTDADQIIIAEVGPHPAQGLPSITYVAGGLEDVDIRKAVCDILEGGEEAFRERARRLRVRLER
jgi:AAA domain, putative AbiEii toxin, Type IV TA system